MEIREILALRGPNIWSRHPVLASKPRRHEVVSSVTTVTSPSPGAVTRVMTPRRWRKRRMRLLALCPLSQQVITGPRVEVVERPTTT
jgi:hypothetical protein